MHGAVSAAVAEGQDRHLAYLLGYLQHLVGLEVLDNQLVGADEAFLLAESVVDTLFVALASGFQLHVHSDDPVGGDADGLDQRTADEAVGAGDNVIGESVVLQVIEHLQHGLVETLAVGHPGKAVRRLGCVCFHISVELGNGHSGVGRGGSLCVFHVEMVRKFGPKTDKVTYFLCGLLNLRRSLVLVVRIIQRPVFQKVVFEVCRIEFADEGAVHVKGGDAVRRLDVIPGRRVSHILDILLQGSKGFAGIPQGEIVLPRVGIVL